jgi:hypothetical protein
MKKETVLYIGSALLVYFGIVKPLLDKLGVTKSEADKAIESAESSTDSAFAPNYWRKQKGKVNLITQASLQPKIKAIYDSITYLGSDFNKILSVFKSLKYKTQVSFLAENFAKKYNTDLFGYLKNGKSNRLVHNALRDEQLTTLINLVNGLQ